MKLIGLAGRMGSGKDTVAAMLAPHGYERFAFADGLRREVEAAMLEKYAPPGCLSDDAVEAFLYAPIAEIRSKPTTPRMRALLQQWGTEYRRGQDPDYWTGIMRERLSTVGAAAISDVRFANEAELVRELGGEVWLIERPGCQTNGHASEALAFAVDRVIDNSGDMEHLRNEVARALGEVK
ncbi:MAG: hypothetical protein ABFD89_13225 [Bryobacteraceae bacterium]